MPQPIIVFDVRTLQDQYAKRGVGRYSREIISRLIPKAVQSGYQPVLAGLGTGEEVLHELNCPPNQVAFESIGEISASTPIHNLMEYYLNFRPAVQKLNPAKIFSPYFERGALPGSILMVHDAIPLRTGKFSKKDPITNWLKSLFYKHMWYKQSAAHALLCPTNTAKKEITQFGKLSESKLQVVNHGVSGEFKPASSFPDLAETLGGFGLAAGKYLIHDSGLEANKNPSAVAAIWNVLAAKTDLKLVITGGDFRQRLPVSSGGREFMNQLTPQARQGLVTPGVVSDQTLARLFAGAAVYLNTSGYEGFGFGPLQAMQSNVPAAINQDNECFQEVCAQAATYIEVGSPASAAAAILGLINDTDLRQQTTEAGFAHAQKFSWDTAAQQTWDIIGASPNLN